MSLEVRKFERIQALQIALMECGVKEGRRLFDSIPQSDENGVQLAAAFDIYFTNLENSLERQRRLANCSETKFSPDQLKGLEEVGYTFIANIQPFSVSDLAHDPETAKFLTSLHWPNLGYEVPRSGQIALNRDQLVVPGTQGISYVHQLNMAEAYALGLKNKHLFSGTLEGVEFRVPLASELIQADLAYRATNPRRRLIRNKHGSNDILTAEFTYDCCINDFVFLQIERIDNGDLLQINNLFTGLIPYRSMVALVAVPT